jgi:hypothetical protein
MKNMAKWKSTTCSRQSRRMHYPRKPRSCHLSSTWAMAMKKKSNGTYHVPVTAIGYIQFNGIHYDEDTKASPVMSEAMILITFVPMLPAGWVGYIVDVNSAFFHGQFKK